MRTALLAALALSFALPALAFGPSQRMRVTALGGNDFRVEFASGAEESDYWCAAGAYVTRTLGLVGKTRIFRASPEPRKRNQGITFTLDKARSTGSTGITIYGGLQDGGISASSAFQYCYDFEIDRFGFLR